MAARLELDRIRSEQRDWEDAMATDMESASDEIQRLRDAIEGARDSFRSVRNRLSHNSAMDMCSCGEGYMCVLAS